MDHSRYLNPDAVTPDNHVIVLFGATGNLSKLKLLPGLFHLHAAGLLPAGCRIIGTSPIGGAPSVSEFVAHARESVETYSHVPATLSQWAAFEAILDFAPADPDNAEQLVAAVARSEAAIGGNPRRLFHLAIPPAAFAGVIAMLSETGLNQNARVIFEKPFGNDLASAQALNSAVHSCFAEDQVFRIDHFLGKESIDNVLALRFANGMFEPIWNHNHIAYVQIDVPETLTAQGRSGFYEGTGAFKDMVVTHLLQVLGFIAMEPPSRLSAAEIASAKQGVFDALRPLSPTQAVYGQYDGYRDEVGVAPDSVTETFAALQVRIDNPRWEGVKFLLRTGKALQQSAQQIVLGLKEPHHHLFPKPPDASIERPNEIVIDFSDPGAIFVSFMTKEPGPRMRLEPARMSFSYADSFCTANGLAPYQHLILEAMLGDRSLFTTAAQVERLWERSAPLLDAPPVAEPYPPGSWGPASADDLAAPHGWELSRPS